MQINMTRHASMPDTSIKEFSGGCMLKLVMILKFSTNEYCEMVSIYNECGRQARAAERLYRQSFPRGLHPSRQVIKNGSRRRKECPPNLESAGQEQFDSECNQKTYYRMHSPIFRAEQERSVNIVASQKNTFGLF